MVERSDINALSNLNRILLAQNLELARSQRSAALLPVWGFVGGALGFALALVLLQWATTI